jgi:8-oxo-dGTP pyrophosphatase MutT (NUDIX family)
MKNKILPKISAGIVPYKFKNKETQFLLLRVFNYWDFPKGHVEKGENYLTAAIREPKEETNVFDIHFPFGNTFYQTEVYGEGKAISG